ncbi:FkbM family methyltransferase [Amylibacter sp. SFDW26]|uniref:FkbM family methyltransferase n=1 Tax=Amylibacter sp. SFDW26 TaxID=2652722 RepID=UPI0012619318|nr:FkbM family methyltransferase [Amylibacter sp. SFDW26]KAB7610075.1 FkbM family methyltransferase [Amylibacter sp. SFDW26]
MKIAQGLETWVKTRLPTSLRDRLHQSKYRYIMRKTKPIELIVHIGAHYAEDRFFYEELGAETVLWIEADPGTFKTLKSTLNEHPKNTTNHLMECALVSSHDDTVLEFYKFNGDGASSSVYRASERLRETFEHVHETGEVLKLKSKTLTSILEAHNIDIKNAENSMLVVDVQGHEMAVLEGATQAISEFKFCKCEVSRIEIYTGGAQFCDVDDYFRSKQFKLSSHPYWRVPKHGDVLYTNIKDPK